MYDSQKLTAYTHSQPLLIAMLFQRAHTRWLHGLYITLILAPIMPDTRASQPVKVLHAFVWSGEWSLHNGCSACFCSTMFSLLIMEWDRHNTQPSSFSWVSYCDLPPPRWEQCNRRPIIQWVTGCILDRAVYCLFHWVRGFVRGIKLYKRL